MLSLLNLIFHNLLDDRCLYASGSLLHEETLKHKVLFKFQIHLKKEIFNPDHAIGIGLPLKRYYQNGDKKWRGSGSLSSPQPEADGVCPSSSNARYGCAPLRTASLRVKVPSVELDDSQP